jgi:cytochrome c peroxidase
MKYSILAAALIIFICGCHAPAEKATPLQQVHDFVDLNLDTLQGWLDTEFIPAISSYDTNKIKSSFFTGRKLYKRIEFAVEYFFNNAARSINGPPLPEIEPEEHIVLDPGGFQVIEEYLYPFDTTQKKELLREAGRMKSMLVRTKTLWEGTQFRDDQIFDALRLELFRIITLGISGFDTPLSFKGIDEVPEALASVKQVIGFYTSNKQYLDSAINYAINNNDFNGFDRLTFTTKYINPATRNLLALQRQLNIPVIKNIYALNGDIETLFDEKAFNTNYFSPDATSHTTPDRAALGKRLFHDPILSENNKISCASCHHPEKAFTDGLTKSKALGGEGFLARNTPTLINASLQKMQFYDMRSTFLEDQVRNVVENKDEIHGDMKKAVALLYKDSSYRKLFKQAFNFDTVTERNIQVALSCYIRSLTSFNSRFDKYMRGDENQLNAEERSGFNVFMGKAKCGICHFMPVFNGTVPPSFTFTESEVIGVPADKKGTKLDPDMGRYAIYQIDNFKNAFKTPTVRNIALTAPYMHNGVYQTLEEVVDFYNRGGGAGLGYNVDNQTLPFDSLQLSNTEKKHLVAFMKTLTDVTLMLPMSH